MADVFDVIVVGGGLSGLAAADQLSKGGLKVLVLEASERWGGRTLTVKSKDGGAHDLGGHWLAPSQHLMHRLCKELGLKVQKQNTRGYAVMEKDGKILKYKGTVPPVPLISQAEVGLRAFWQLERMARQVAGPDGLLRSDAKEVVAWDGQTLETWKQQSFWTQPAKDLLDVAVRLVWGCECRDLSLLHVLYNANVSGGFAQLVDVEGAAQDSHIEGGAQQVSDRLSERVARREGCSCVLEAPVHMIDYSGGSDSNTEDVGHSRGVKSSSPQQEVPSTSNSSLDGLSRQSLTDSNQKASGLPAAVHSAKGVFKAKFVIVAVPPTMINKHISFHPPLPFLRQQMGDRYFMGSYTKAVVSYATPFWRARGFSGEAMGAAYSREFPVLMSFDASKDDGSHAALACFITGDPADDQCSLPVKEQEAGVIRSLVRFFGDEARDFLEISIKAWASDPWTRGCPANLAPPGVSCKYASVLRQPIGPLHWAATETATRWFGYMEGAVQAGHRVAKEISIALQRHR